MLFRSGAGANSSAGTSGTSKAGTSYLGKINRPGWDWPELYYLGVVVLHMSDKTFWRTTPAKLTALSEAHSVANNPSHKRVARTVEEAGIEI